MLRLLVQYTNRQATIPGRAAELEIVFVVQLQASDAILTLADRIFTHSRITLYLVYCFSVFIQSHFHIVEERRVRRPQFSISRHCQFNRYSVQRCAFGYKVFAIEYFYFHFVCGGRIGSNFYLNRIVVNIGVVFRLVMYCVATGSNHTVCQIPVTGVYQMP